MSSSDSNGYVQVVATSQHATAFFALHIAGGYVLLPILVLTFIFSSRVHRPPTVINFCVAWSVFSITYSLLMYISPRDRTLHPPNFALCVSQAALIHGVTPMAAVASLSLVAQVYRVFRLPSQSKNYRMFPSIPPWCLTIIIVLPPYLALVVFAVPAAYIGYKHPDGVLNPSGLWCTLALEVEPFRKLAVEGFSVAIASIIAVLEVIMITQYFRTTLRIKKLDTFTNHTRPFLSPFVRVLIFTLYTMLAVSANVLFIVKLDVPIRYMAPAALPLCAAVVFGSQNDIFYACFPWANKSSNTINQGNQFHSSDGGWSTAINEEFAAVTESQFSEHSPLPSPV